MSAIEDGELASGVIALLTTDDDDDEIVMDETMALEVTGLARAQHEAFVNELAEASVALWPEGEAYYGRDHDSTWMPGDVWRRVAFAPYRRRPCRGEYRGQAWTELAR